MKIVFSDIIDNSKQVLINPKLFWVDKKVKLDSQSKLTWGFLIPILFIVAIAVFLGEFFRYSDFYTGTALLKSLRIVVLFLLQYFIAVFFTNELIKTFGGEKSISVSRNLVAYSLTPLLFVSIVTGLIPFLYVVGILGLYSCYVFWMGVEQLLVFPDNKKSSYTIITIVVNFFIFSFLSIVLSKLVIAYY